MHDIAVVGDSSTEQWVARQDTKLCSEGLRCHFVHWQQRLDDLPEPDLWLGDLDAMAPHHLESLGKPLAVMARTYSLELAQSALSMGAARCFGKPVTPRALSELCRELGIGAPPFNGRLAVLESQDSLYHDIEGILSVAGLSSIQLTDIRTGVETLQHEPPDGLVLSHFPEALPIRSVIDLLRSFPELISLPVFILKGKARREELLAALSTLVDVVYVARIGELADAVTMRLNRALPANATRHRLYEKFHDHEQERRALHLHAIVSKADRAGRIIEVNDRFCEISGYCTDELIGQNHRILKSDIHSPEFYHDLWLTISRGGVWRGEICNQAKDGSLYWVSSTIVPYLDKSGRPYQYIAIRKDITHIKNADVLISQQAGLASCLGELGARLLGVDLQNAVHGLRAALAPLCHLLRAEGIALDLQWSYPFLQNQAKTLSASEELPALWIHTAETTQGDSGSGGTSPFEAPLIVNNVRLGKVSLHGAFNPINETFAKQGLIELFANILVGALARWQREYEHEQSRERLRMAQKYSGIGTWEWNIATGELYWTEQIPVLFGYAEGTLQTSYENFIAAVHPEDRELVEMTIRRTVDEDLPYRIEHRVIWPDGQVRWLLESGDITRDKNSKAIRMLGVVQDITKIREADLKLERQSSLLNVLHDSLNAFVLEGGFKTTLDTMLDHLLRLTASEFGYLAEVLYDHSENPYLRVQAITGISRDAFSSDMVSHVGTARFEFREMDNMLGACTRNGRPVVVDQASAGAPFNRLLPGHPEIKTFLNVPIFVGMELVGTFALANRNEGYDEALIEFLRPFMATYGVLIKSQRMLDMEAVSHKNLIRAKQRADLANRAKSEFLSSMSHELRTPLNAILGFGQLLEADVALDEEQRDNVQEILNASKHLLTLINEVLDLAKIESGKLDLSLESIPVPELLEEALTLVRHMAQGRGISLRTERADGLRVTADWTRLKQAVLNLISNAIKYNRSEGSVLISARQHGENWVDIRVSDTGPGIEPSRITELFQPFNRLGAELSHIEGTGIGLALTQRLVELMGGSIGVESQVGEGSTFWLRLPAEDGGSAIDASGAPVVQAPTQPAQTSDEPLEDTKTILYIEDNPANLKLVARILQRYSGVQLLATASGIEGVTMAKVEQPNLVLMDINLPDTDGYQILRALKADHKTADIPVIALTANAMHNDVRWGKQAGFDDYLTKPISVDELLATLKTHLR